MKLKPEIWIIILAVLLCGITWQTFKLTSEKNALEKSVNTLEGKFEDLEKENIRMNDSLEKVSQSTGRIIEQRGERIKEIQEYLEKILKTEPNEAVIDNMHDVDSIRDLFTRNFPDNP